jgi:NAD(P)-dependent dehydrogenase (short-subunit alcohol dehydrogenase family)
MVTGASREIGAQISSAVVEAGHELMQSCPSNQRADFADAFGPIQPFRWVHLARS